MGIQASTNGTYSLSYMVEYPLPQIDGELHSTGGSSEWDLASSWAGTVGPPTIPTANSNATTPFFPRNPNKNRPMTYWTKNRARLPQILPRMDADSSPVASLGALFNREGFPIHSRAARGGRQSRTSKSPT